MILLKTIVWRVLSFSIALVMGRLWFGNWHVTGFTVFITVLMMVVYYIFEKLWVKMEGKLWD